MFVSFLLLVGLSATFASPVLPEEQAVGGKIVGGRNATIEEVPYLVSIMVDGSHNCGGSIITEFWVVSAAHCFTRAVNRHAIRAGTTLRNTGGIVHEVETYINHPSYGSPARYANDIAIVKVVEPFQFSAQIQPIILPELLENVAAGATSVISGFGRLWSGGPLPTVVQIVEVPIVSLERCRIDYTGWELTEDMLCAGIPEGGIDACQGDSGGPLVVDGKLHGAVSWGYGCAVPGFPGVYARVAFFIDWIKGHTGRFR